MDFKNKDKVVSKLGLDNQAITDARRDCIDCGRCTTHCDFLTKYKVNLKELSYREDIKYSCFLCNKCNEVCPVDLSGRDIVLEMRRANPNKNFAIKFMKEPYKFRNLSDKKSGYLLFLGCNYPGAYPKTCEKVIEICSERGIDFSIDCCKKPIIEQGLEADYDSFYNNLKNKDVHTLITLCPNCYATLKNRFEGINVISIYEFLLKENIGSKLKDNINVFFPCSDKEDKEIFSRVLKYADSYNSPYESVNCCGLGGGASKHEKDLIEERQKKLLELDTENIYTYCASCSLMFRKFGLKNIKNFLSEILEVHEEPSKNYLKNVLKFSLLKRKEK